MLNKCAELFTNHLNEEGLSFSSGVDGDGDSVVEFPYKGKKTKIFFTGEDGSYLSMYLVYENVPEERRTDVICICNDLNCQYKWVKFYVDKVDNVVIQHDAILNVENSAAEAFELLVRMIQISEEAKPIIMKGIYG